MSSTASAAASVIVPSSATQALQHVARKLEEAQGKIERDSTCPWPDEMLGSPSGCDIDMPRATLRGHLDDLQSLKSLSKGMLLLVEKLDAIITRRCETLLPASRHHGLAMFPNEMLLLVFKHLLKSYEDAFEGARVMIRDLSLVSNHFRRMILGFTEVWTYLDLDRLQTKRNLRMLIGRSEGGLLSVRFRSSEALDPILQCSLASRDRWHYIHAVFPDGGYDDEKRRKHALPISFPSVRTLTMEMDELYAGYERWPKWMFPRVEAFELIGSFPRPNEVSWPNGICYDSLRRFSFKWNGKNEATLDDLVDFLKPAASLHTLHVNAAFLTNLSEEDYSCTVDLPSVKTFSITNFSSSEDQWYRYCEVPSLSQDEFVTVIRSMVLPNVEDISVSVAFYEDDFSVAKFLRGAFPSSRRLCPVNTLKFRISRVSRNEDTIPIYVRVCEFFQHFPDLHRFELDTGNCDVVSLSAAVLPKEQMERLRLLRITYDSTSPYELSTLFERIARASAPLEKLEIHSTYPLDLQTLRGILPETSVRATIIRI